MTPLRCPPGLVDETLESLRAAGRRCTEGVVLWLAKRPLTEGVAIAETYVPEHYAEVDVFRIPPSGMTAMMAHLRERKLGLAAQVHSHPHRAFHSRADDAWAIVRHEGALSIVVPDFAAGVTAANFLEMAATFRLSPTDQWIAVPQHELPDHLAISP
jgi:proteasome lid subunit RPN8/RPN11